MIEKANEKEYNSRVNVWESIAYIGLCIMTFGVAFALRVIITIAIKKAYQR